jgi:hypothetical protein
MTLTPPPGRSMQDVWQPVIDTQGLNGLTGPVALFTPMHGIALAQPVLSQVPHTSPKQRLICCEHQCQDRQMCRTDLAAERLPVTTSMHGCVLACGSALPALEGAPCCPYTETTKASFTFLPINKQRKQRTIMVPPLRTGPVGCYHSLHEPFLYRASFSYKCQLAHLQ